MVVARVHGGLGEKTVTQELGPQPLGAQALENPVLGSSRSAVMTAVVPSDGSALGRAGGNAFGGPSGLQGRTQSSVWQRQTVGTFVAQLVWTPVAVPLSAPEHPRPAVSPAVSVDRVTDTDLFGSTHTQSVVKFPTGSLPGAVIETLGEAQKEPMNGLWSGETGLGERSGGRAGVARSGNPTVLLAPDWDESVVSPARELPISNEIPEQKKSPGEKTGASPIPWQRQSVGQFFRAIAFAAPSASPSIPALPRRIPEGTTLGASLGGAVLDPALDLVAAELSGEITLEDFTDLFAG